MRHARILLIGMGVAITGLAGTAAGPVIATPDAVAATPSGSATVQLVLPLRARYAALRRLATEVSTPGSRLYGRYQSLPRLERRFGARPGVERRVVRYLRARGASAVRRDATGLFVEARLGRAQAERLFGGGTPARAGVPAHLPRALRGLVTGVVGLDAQPLALSSALTSASPSGYEPVTGTQSGCASARAAGGFTPNQYLSAYSFSALQRRHLEGSGERVALIEIDGFRTSDVRTFARCFGLPMPKLVAHGVGGHATLPAGAESTLDLEILAAAAPRLTRIAVYESPADAASVLEALTAPLQRSRRRPQVISISLGLCERTLIGAVGRAGLRASSAALELAAASGISIVAASGDTGSSDCRQSPDDGPGEPLPALAVNYPSSSPWVTAVGGTNITLDAANAITGQVVWNDAGEIPGDAGGGGFSLLFRRPRYQRGIVGRDRRALPDVALLADVAPGYDIYCTTADCGSRGWQTIGGTSAATPLLAGGLALVDQRLRKLIREPLGLANPLLYELGRHSATRRQVFDDVTVGDDDVIPFTDPGAAPLSCCTARRGFDEASGWGGIDLAAFESQALRRQPKLRR